MGNALGRLFGKYIRQNEIKLILVPADTYTYVSYKKDGSELPPGKHPQPHVASDLVID